RRAFLRSLRIGVRELGPAHEHLGAHSANGAKLAVRARCDLAPRRNLQPFADVAVLADALPHFRCRTVDCDFHRNGRIGWRRHHHRPTYHTHRYSLPPSNSMPSTHPLTAA